jgi:hypothetical protein
MTLQAERVVKVSISPFEEELLKFGYCPALTALDRDNCQCSNCVHEATKQRLLDTFTVRLTPCHPYPIAFVDRTQIPSDISIQSHSFAKDKIEIEC